MFKQKKYLQNNQRFFNTLNLIFYLAVAIPMAPFTYYYLTFSSAENLTASFPEHPSILIFYITPILIFICMVLSFIVYRTDLKKVLKSSSFKEKMDLFLKFSIKKYLFLELASLGILAGFIYTGQKFFATLYVISLLVFSFSRPTVTRIARDMKLEKSEKEKLYGEQEF